MSSTITIDGGFYKSNEIKDEFGVLLKDYLVDLHPWPLGHSPAKGAIVAFSFDVQNCMTVIDHQFVPETGEVLLWLVYKGGDGDFQMIKVPADTIVLRGWSPRKELKKWEKNLPAQSGASPQFESVSGRPLN